MIKMLVFLSLWVPFAAFSQTATSQTYRVPLQSDPAGATITQGGRVLGTAPVTLTFRPAKLDSQGCFETKRLTSSWPQRPSTSYTLYVCPEINVVGIFPAPTPTTTPHRTPRITLSPPEQSQSQLAARLAAAKARLRTTNAAIRRQRNERALMQAAGELGGILGGAAVGVPYAPYVPVAPVAPYPAYPANRYRDNHITCTSTSNGGFAPSVTTDCH